MFQAKKAEQNGERSNEGGGTSTFNGIPQTDTNLFMHYSLFVVQRTTDDERTASWLDLLIFIIVDILIHSVSAAKLNDQPNDRRVVCFIVWLFARKIWI